MAAVPLRASWLAAPATVTAAPRHFHLLGRRGPSSPLVKMHARGRDTFRSNCDKRADHLREPEPEPENHDSDEAETSENCHLVEKILKYKQALKADQMGVREPPDMFVTEKKRISNYKLKLSSFPGMNVAETVMAEIICGTAQGSLDLASEVMDIASLGRDTTEFSQHTVNQMVRTYATIFCNVAEDAYRKKIEMETSLSFLGALRGLGAIYHILVQETVAKLKYGCLKNSISNRTDEYSQDFDKLVKYLEDEIVKIKPEKRVTDILFKGLICAHLYIYWLKKCREAALDYKGVTYYSGNLSSWYRSLFYE